MADLADPGFGLELAVGKTSNRGIIIRDHELSHRTNEAVAAATPLYGSYYRFRYTDLLEHFRLYKTIKAFNANVYCPNAVVDIDRGKHSEDQILAILHAFLERIWNDMPLAEDSVQVWFSGRGFHIDLGNIIKLPEARNTSLFVRATMLKYFPEGDDIYDQSRLLRVGNTINEKSGLYKIPLTSREAMTLTYSEIQSLALTPRLKFECNTLTTIPFLDPVEPTREEIQETAKLDPGELTNFVTCTQIMYRQGPQKGTRHEMLLRIASSRRRGGAPLEATIRDMQSWCPDFHPNEVERNVRLVYSEPYEYGCHDALMAKYCSDKCSYFRHKNFGSSTTNAKSMEASYAEFMKKDFTKSSFDMNEVFPSIKKSYRMLPGEMVVVIGDTKVGKTAFVQNVCYRMKRMRTLYVSTEVNQHLIYRRFIQIAHGMTKQQVESHYQMNTNTLSHSIDHINVIAMPQFMDDIYKAVKSLDAQIVVIDTTDGIKLKHHYRDANNSSNDVALQIRDLATNAAVIVIAVHHIAKSGLIDPSTGKQRGLTVHSGKGASTLEQKADKLIGVEVTDLGYRSIKSLAARDEGEFEIICSMNSDTFQFEDIDYDNRRTFGRI